MAGLTQKDFKSRHGETRIIALIEKLIEGNKSPFTTVDGKQQPFNKITYPDPRSGRLVTKLATDLTDSVDISTVIRTGSVPFKNIQLSYQRGTQTTNMISLDQIMKTSEFGGRSVNAGDMTEIIYSAAVTQRFLNKNQAVVEGDVTEMIKMLNDSDMHQIIGPMKSPNKEPKIVDDLYWEINSPLINIKALKNPRHLRNLKNVIASAVRWANSPPVANAAKKIYENSLYNRIDIKAVGSQSSNDTKIDVGVFIDKQKMDLSVADKQKKFTTKSSGTIDDHKYIWAQLADFKIGPALEKKFFELLKSDCLGVANRIVYKELATQFNRMMTQRSNAVYNSVSDGIVYFSSRQDKTVDMPNNLSAKEVKIFRFHNLQGSLSLMNIDLKAVYVDNKTKPFINFSSTKTGMLLFSLCMRIDEKTNFVSHHIEKGKLMGMLQRIVAP